MYNIPADGIQGFELFEDHWRSRGFGPLRIIEKLLEGAKANWDVDMPAGGVEFTFGRAVQWIDGDQKQKKEGNPARRPFFIFINLMEAHSPLTYHPGFTDPFMAPDDKVSDLLRTIQNPFTILKNPSSLSTEELRKFAILYDGELRFADHHVGLLREKLMERGLLDNTLFIITADHGEAIGDHGMFSHRQSVYEELARVPLIICPPHTESKGLRILKPVQSYDLFRTIIDFTLGEIELPNEALLSVNLFGDIPENRRIVVEEEPAEWAILLATKIDKSFDSSILRNRFKAIYSGNLKYIWGSNGKKWVM